MAIAAQSLRDAKIGFAHVCGAKLRRAGLDTVFGTQRPKSVSSPGFRGTKPRLHLSEATFRIASASNTIRKGSPEAIDRFSQDGISAASFALNTASPDG
ncbi:MAG: hypothetical protein PGN34_23325 [Methylobacterium frigidaeris]